MNVNTSASYVAEPGGSLRQLLRCGSAWVRMGWIVLCLAVAALAGWRSINVHSTAEPLTDSGAFACVGMHVLAGEVPYKDIWEQKPPMIFLLNALALGIGDGTINAIRSMERLFALVQSLLIFLILYRAFRSPLLALSGTCFGLFHFYTWSVFEGGNLTEEYAVVFVLAGALLSLPIRSENRSCSLLRVAGAGLCFSLAVFTKEPFLLSAVPWFFYMALVDSPGWRVALARSGSFILGALLPAVAIASWLAVRGALGDWIDAISFSFSYVDAAYGNASFLARLHHNLDPVLQKMVRLTVTARIAFVIGLASAFNVAYLRKTLYLPLVALLALAMDYWGSSLSGLHCGHYYMQLVPSFVLVGVSGAGFLLYIADRSGTAKCGVLAGGSELRNSSDRKEHVKRLNCGG